MKRLTKILIILFILLFTTQFVSASDLNNTTLSDNNIQSTYTNEKEITSNDPSSNLINQIKTADNTDIILINPGSYKINNLLIDKNITLQGNGNPRDIVFDGENINSILLVRSDITYLTIKNITFINGFTTDFGGAISMETGHVYVDNCIFANNTALGNTNAGAISNYGTMEQRAYLFVNNTLFLNNHAQHDGGAVTTCYASSDIYNCVFINNSAGRDGGAVRVSVYGYGNVADCIFMYNHADEWGGAYYSWASNSKLDRCIFLNNTAGTNGGAVMVSGNITLTNSIIVNNTSNETGGSFYIQNPMFNALTVIDVHNNLITNNTSPLGKEIYINWEKPQLLFTKFNNNDWGDEDPTDSSVIDPDKVTSRSKVTSTTKSNLLSELNLNLLNRYSDILEDYFPQNYFDSDDKDTSQPKNDEKKEPAHIDTNINTNQSTNKQNTIPDTSIQNQQQPNGNNIEINGSKSDVGTDSSDDSRASEIIKKDSSKEINNINIGIVLFVIIAIIALIIGYKKQEKE